MSNSERFRSRGRLPKNIGPELLPSDLTAGDVLDGGPPLGLDQNAALDPNRDVLLLDLPLPADESAHPISERSLAAGNLHGSSNSVGSSSIGFIHKHPRYTNGFVSVNKPVRVTDNKEVCKVVPMVTAKKKPAPVGAKRSSKRVAIPGPDGKTLGQRLYEAMAYRSGQLGSDYTAKDLERDANRIAGANGEAQVISQQAISAILTNKVTRSNFTPYLAEACGVRGAWLAQGNGKMNQARD